MIYTVTFNPSLDYSIRIDDFAFGGLNRIGEEAIRVGGKGINVSIVLNSLGVDNIALGFVAGFTGEHIEAEMKRLGCTTQFTQLPEGFSRINVKLNKISEPQTEMNGQGPSVSSEECNQFIGRLQRTVKAGDCLVLSGSIPRSMPRDMYEKILETIDTERVLVIVDTNSDLLRRTLPYHPFLIKPNLIELGEIFGRTLTEYDDIVGCAMHLQEEGARNVLVSMGADGAILVTEEGQVFSSPAPKTDDLALELVDVNGAGDSMVAGFLAGYLERHSMVDGFAKGLAAGSATVYTAGLADKNQINLVAQRK